MRLFTMSPIHRSDPVILGHVLAEHRDLFQLMQGVQAAITTETAAPSATTDRRRTLHGSLKQLRDHLQAHFVQEERGGFLEEAVTRVPRLSGAVKTVVEEHPALLKELDGLIRDVEAADDSAGAWSRLARGFATFSRHMKEHERRENTVVQEGYNEDLGLLQ